MKRTICIFLVLSLVVSLAVPSFANEPEEPRYGIINVEFSDALGTIEQLDVMVKDDHVYADVEALSERLGYQWMQEDQLVSIYADNLFFYQDAPLLAVHYRIDSTDVSYNPLFGAEWHYTAPAPCVENDEGVWVPLTYTIVLLGGNSTLLDNTLLIQMPQDNVLSVAAMIFNNDHLLSFDWVENFGYSETTTDITNGAARVVTLFSGLLEFDGDAWLSLIDWNAFDKKFGKSLAMMFCTNSAEELQKSIDQVEMLLDVFSPEGKAGEMLRNKQLRIDNDVTAWKSACEEYLELLEDGSGSPTKYNLLYRQYERAMDDQSLFAALGGDDVIYIQDELSSAANVLDIASKIGSAVSYFSEFQQKDTYQISVLKNYLSTRSQTDKIPEATATSMMKYISSTDDAGQYVFSRFLEENALELIVDKSGLDAYLGAPANILLLAWDIMSGTIPFYSEGLKAVENREISNYAQKMQNDALLNLNYLMSNLRSNGSLGAEECVQLSEYCYVYLKACYIARSAAIKSLDNTSEEFQEEIKGKIDVETDINKIIAEYLAVLSNADKENECYSLGFLPEDNDRYLSDYSDEALIEAIDSDDRVDSDSLVTDAYMDVIIDGNNTFCYHIPQVNLKGNRGSAVNHTIYDQLYSILSRDVYQSMENYDYPSLSKMVYIWGECNNLVSVVVETKPHYEWYDYYVYTISTDTGNMVSQEELLAHYGYDLSSFRLMTQSVLKNYWDEKQDIRDRVGEDWFDDRMEKTLSEQNLRECIPFVAPDGSLGFVAKIYSLAAAEYYYHLMYAQPSPTLPEYIVCKIDHASDRASVPTNDPLEYFIENCDRIYFTEEDAEVFDKEKCMYARNAIFAKSGRQFKSEDLKVFFAKYGWYNPVVAPEDFTDSMLNTIQKENLALIMAREAKIEQEAYLASLTGEKAIYTNYLHSKGYDDILQLRPRDNVTVKSLLADLDNDGVQELLLSIDTGESGIRGKENYTLVLDQADGEVIIPIMRYYGGGSMGGNRLIIKYDLEKDTHVVVSNNFTRDGAYASCSELVILSGKEFTEEKHISRTFYNMNSEWYQKSIEQVKSETDLYEIDEYDFYFYQIDGQYVSQEEYENAVAQYTEAHKAYQMIDASYDIPIP